MGARDEDKEAVPCYPKSCRETSVGVRLNAEAGEKADASSKGSEEEMPEQEYRQFRQRRCEH